jgi:hypothetical protein
MLFVFATRWPVARAEPLESDEFGFLAQAAAHWLPMHHTLFVTFGRILGRACGDPYRGFILLDMLASAGALVSAWWMLRAMVRPATALAGALALGVSPVFWGYGGMAGNYTAIVLVGSFLLGVAYRGQQGLRVWHPFGAAVVLALGAGYRQDIGTFWLPVFGVILWQHRWKRALQASILFTLINVIWISAMLNDVGGWSLYRAASAEFAYECGYLNSVWNLGFIDGPTRYSVKLGMALLWTLGPALLFVPRGAWRIARIGGREMGSSNREAKTHDALAPTCLPDWLDQSASVSRVVHRDKAHAVKPNDYRDFFPPLAKGGQGGVGLAQANAGSLEGFFDVSVLRVLRRLRLAKFAGQIIRALRPHPPSPLLHKGGQEMAASFELARTEDLDVSNASFDTRWSNASSRQLRFLVLLLPLSVTPALASHLFIHFGVPGYCFHYVPALMILIVLGIGSRAAVVSQERSFGMSAVALLGESDSIRLVAIATLLAAMFWCYPTDYTQPGWRGSFDLSFCRFTRIGLNTPIPNRAPEYWRTANSRPFAGTPPRRPVGERAGEG